MKIIDINIKVFVKKIIVILVFKVDNSSIYMKIALINQDIIILL